MSASEENFEKLEAYIDGALDAADRAEVERMLSLNPQLRTMVAELSQGRELLMALPHVTAPPDVVETFQGHLERAALLGDSGSEQADVVLRINRWPQIMSIAAIVALTFGLAAVVYRILPKHQPNAVAVNTSWKSLPVPATSTTPQPLVTDGSVFAAKEGGGGGRGEVLGGRSTPADSIALAGKPAGVDASTHSLAVATPMLKNAGETAAGITDNRPQVSPEELRLAQRMAKGGMREATAGGTASRDSKLKDASLLQPADSEGPIMLLVRAKDPQLADEDVSEFLVQNDVPFVSVPEGLGYPAAAAGNGTAFNYDQLQAGVAANSASANLTANSGVNNAGLGTSATAPADGPYARGGGFGGQQQPGRLGTNGTVNGANSDLGASSQKRTAERFFGAGQDALHEAQQVPAPTTRPASPDGAVVNNSANGVTNGNFINSSNGNGVTGTYRAMLTNRQLNELNDRIARRPNQWAEMRNDGPNELSVARPEAERIASNLQSADKAKGEAGEVAELRKGMKSDGPSPGGPEGLASNKEATQAPAAPAERAKVPQIVALDEPAQQVPQKVAAPSPTTQPGFALAPATTQPAAVDRSLAIKAEESKDLAEAPQRRVSKAGEVLAQQQVEMEKQAQVPAPGGAVDADEPHEVLIVVNDQPINLPTALPATQPATRPSP